MKQRMNKSRTAPYIELIQHASSVFNSDFCMFSSLITAKDFALSVPLLLLSLPNSYVMFPTSPLDEQLFVVLLSVVFSH